MDKDFDTWNGEKKRIHSANPSVYFYEREVWWCSLGVNVGFEQDGKGSEFARPVLVLRKFHKDACLVVPLTTTKRVNKYLFPVSIGESQSNVILSQVRFLSPYIKKKRVFSNSKNAREKLVFVNAFC